MIGDNIGVEYVNVVYVFEELFVKVGLFWVGMNDGLIYVSCDNGENWENFSVKVLGMLEYGVVRNIDVLFYVEGMVYMMVDVYEMGDFKFYVYCIEDFGKSWIKIIKGIFDLNLSYC